MKTIGEWLEELPEPYRTKAINNAIQQNGKTLHYEAETLEQAIGIAFLWSESPEGGDYWSKVSDGKYKQTTMKEVIRIPKDGQIEEEKPVEFTHFMDETGWELTRYNPKRYEKVLYLGKCTTDGDMFACYSNGLILIYKGHLNSGKY